MNLALMQWISGVVPEILKISVLSKFTTRAYYYMSWSDDRVMAEINAVVDKAAKGSLPTENPYSIVYKFLADRHLLKS
jgi:hypothetical protein